MRAVCLAAVMAVVPLSAQVFNTATVTVAGGPDEGTYTAQVGPGDAINGWSCEVRPRADRQPGTAFRASFYPGARGVTKGPATGADAPMETAVSFDVDPNGTTKEVDLVVTFALKTELGMRPYEVNTREFQSPGRKKAGGRASATLVQKGGTARANVQAETTDGVTFTLDIDCQSVGKGRG